MKKTTFWGIIVTLTMTLMACSNGHDSQSSTFPNIDDANIPDVLELTVGTLGNCYFSSGISDNPDYDSVLCVTFDGTTETDHTTLMEHYQSSSTGTDENGSMLFDWGILQVAAYDDSISINAFIK